MIRMSFAGDIDYKSINQIQNDQNYFILNNDDNRSF